jgi:Ca2+:H+ antiporter
LTTQTPEAATKRSFLLTGEGWPYLLVPLIPVAILLESSMQTRADLCRFRAWRHPDCRTHGRATEELAARSGPGIGGFLNVTFGNAPELIIALFALAAGLHEVVKASVVGSILGNILLVMASRCLPAGCDATGSSSKHVPHQRSR